VIRWVLGVAGAASLAMGGGTAAAGMALHGAASGGFEKPVHGASVSQGFGCTRYAFEPVDGACAGGHWHSGVDLAAAAGTPVHATLGGVVAVLLSPGGYGLHVVIDHSDGLTSLYGHLEAVSVVSGAYVATGTVIGAVGSTGNSTGPHLHFEIRRDGVAEDPRLDVALP